MVGFCKLCGAPLATNKPVCPACSAPAVTGVIQIPADLRARPASRPAPAIPPNAVDGARVEGAIKPPAPARSPSSGSVSQAYSPVIPAAEPPASPAKTALMVAAALVGLALLGWGGWAFSH